jgi:ligand-binding SRPBCC domain-containing protein
MIDSSHNQSRSEVVTKPRGQETKHSFEIPDHATEAVFELFCDPRRLNALTPPWFRLIVRGSYSPPLRIGSRIGYRLQWRGLPLAWRSVITELQPPHWLVYEQDRGPFRSFRHEHSFEPSERGVIVTDRILCKVLGGSWVDRTLVGPDLRRILRYRERAATEILRQKAQLE